MNRLLKLLPPLTLTACLAAGEVSGFRPQVMRPLCLALALVLIPAGLAAIRRRLWSDIHLTLAAYPLLAGLAWWATPQSAQAFSRAGAGMGVYLLLALAVSLPRLWGRPPFTTFFARQSTPKAFWDTDVFRTINSHMTWTWCGLFVVCAGLAGLPALAPAALGGTATRVTLTTILPMVLMLGLGAPFNRWYPAHYQRRLGITPVTGPAGQENIAPNPPAPPAAPAPLPKEETMSQRPVVAALNASPHAGMGNTGQMIEMLRPGLEAEGLDLKVINLHGKEIEHCIGCGFCMERGACWIDDDHKGVAQELVNADALVLGSPVYFYHVTGQMKTFLDRSLAYGHKPRGSWKPGLALSVTARVGETEVAEYLAKMLRVYGAFSIGTFTALATKPGEFLGKETVEARAADLARDLARAVREKRRYPVTGGDYIYWLFMRELVADNKDGVMRDDYAHWEKKGLTAGFEAYAQQEYTRLEHDDSVRQAWIKQLIAERKAGKRPGARPEPPAQPAAPAAPAAPAGGAQAARTCRELLQMMPLGFRAEAGQGLDVVYQFEVSGGEEFTAHLRIAEGKCTYHDGPAAKADVVVKTPAQVWLDIAQGRLDGQGAFMSGKYKVEGNILLLMRLKDLFG